MKNMSMVWMFVGFVLVALFLWMILSDGMPSVGPSEIATSTATSTDELTDSMEPVIILQGQDKG